MNVGTSGSCGCRVALEIARARRRPARTNGIGAVTASEPTGGSPATTAVAAGPAPLCGMWVMSSFADILIRSIDRCVVVPMPEDLRRKFQFHTRAEGVLPWVEKLTAGSLDKMHGYWTAEMVER